MEEVSSLFLKIVLWVYLSQAFCLINNLNNSHTNKAVLDLINWNERQDEGVRSVSV